MTMDSRNASDNGANKDHDGAISALNRLLRGEWAAVETYRSAMEEMQDSTLRNQLGLCQLSHEARAMTLAGRIEDLGGQPAEGSGLWGSFARAIEGGAELLGPKAALAPLEEGEELGLRLYGDELHRLDDLSRALVESDLVPAQRKSHALVGTLKRTLH